MKYRMDRAPMGWNSYDHYDTTVTEKEVRANADHMAAHMKDAGWEYIVVDIGWYANDAGTMRDRYQYIPFGDQQIDSYGRLWPAVERFPSSAGGKGFGPLASYIHGLGLKFGIHIMRGIPRAAAHQHLPVLGTAATADEIADPYSICRWNPDMYGVRKDAEGAQAYYDSIVSLYAQWGVDFIKCDDICNTNMYPHDPYHAAHEVEMLQRAIQKTGRDIVLSLSPGPALIGKAWHYERYANMWRITDDFWDDWELLKDMFSRCRLWQGHVSKGAYPDCDMLPVGRIGKGFGHERDTGFTKDEQITMMTLWCIFGSPLMIGAELTKLDGWTMDLLTRKEILELTDARYVGRESEHDDSHVVWSCLDEGTGEAYIALFNLLDASQEICCDLAGVEQFAGMDIRAGSALELWSQREVPIRGEMLTDIVPAHGAALFALRTDKR